ncbi:hypothetical protein JCM6882_000528 [Rhodosporidiobolus microsporus]
MLDHLPAPAGQNQKLTRLLDERNKLFGTFLSLRDATPRIAQELHENRRELLKTAEKLEDAESGIFWQWVQSTLLHPAWKEDHAVDVLRSDEYRCKQRQTQLESIIRRAREGDFFRPEGDGEDEAKLQRRSSSASSVSSIGSEYKPKGRHEASSSASGPLPVPQVVKRRKSLSQMVGFFRKKP